MSMSVAMKLVITALVVAQVICSITADYPPLDLNAYWGPGSPTPDDTTIVPFQINVTDAALADLQSRLVNARPYVPPLEDVAQNYGINTILLKNITDYWINQYNWRERETFLNQYPQFQTRIQGLLIHYIHVTPASVPQGAKVIPLLLLHGWPGSVREFYGTIPYLTAQNSNDFVFELVIASLPGFGFSEGASKPGLGARETAVIFKNLMARLGHDTYYVQGGDMGSIVNTNMAIDFPETVKGVHLNLCVSSSVLSVVKIAIGSIFPRLVVDEKNEPRLYPLINTLEHGLLESGFFHLQATKPDTVGVGLHDSPVGLAAYIIEKFIGGTNNDYIQRLDGGLLDVFTYDTLLDNVMLYWVPGSITTSMRFYAESVNKREDVLLDSRPVKVPTACAYFDHEVIYMPPSIAKDKYNKIIQANEYPGGHFAALQNPEGLSTDVWLAVAAIETL